MEKLATIAAKPYYVYIVRCADSTLYTGVALNVASRIHCHNNTKHGAKYTRSRRPVQLMYSRAFSNKREALQEELRIKSLTRRDKELLMSSVSFHS